MNPARIRRLILLGAILVLAGAAAYGAVVLLATQPSLVTAPQPTACPDTIACHVLKRKPTPRF